MPSGVHAGLRTDLLIDYIIRTCWLRPHLQRGGGAKPVTADAASLVDIGTATTWAFAGRSFPGRHDMPRVQGHHQRADRKRGMLPKVELKSPRAS
jgi:hypothetical protein